MRTPDETAGGVRSFIPNWRAKRSANAYLRDTGTIGEHLGPCAAGAKERRC